MLVEMGAVEEGQAVGVLGEVRGHPVQDDADVVLVAVVHEVHEVIGVAEAAGGRKVAGGLVAPRAVERVLGDGQQLDVGVVHLQRVLDQLVGQIPVVEKAVVLGHAPPTAQMHLVDVDGLVQTLARGTLGHPCLVLPCVLVHVPHPGIGARTQLGVEAVGIGFVDFVAQQLGFDRVLVMGALGQIGDEEFPQARIPASLHGMGAIVPAVERTDDADALGIGRPHGKAHAGHPVERGHLRAQLGVALQEIALAEEIDLVLGQAQGEAVRVFQLVCGAALVHDDQAIDERLAAPAEDRLEEAAAVDARHFRARARGHVQHVNAVVQRAEGADHEAFLAVDHRGMRPQHVERRAVIAAHDRGHIGRLRRSLGQRSVRGCRF